MSMTELDSLGPTPSEEQCAQTVDNDFPEKNRAECKRYIDLLNKIYPSPSEHVCLAIQVERGHDFGPYREVVIRGDLDKITSHEEYKKVQDWMNSFSKMPNTWAELEAMVPTGN